MNTSLITQGNVYFHNILDIHMNIILGKEATEGLMKGIKIATDAVKGTMGASGKNVVIEEDSNPGHRITNDGATIIQHIHLTDPLEKRGLEFVKEAVNRSNENSGDGSTTTTVLLNAILEEGMKQESNGMEIKDSLDKLLPFIERKIDEQKRTITENEVEAVATTAGESEELGKLLSEIYKKVGKDGIIHLEGSGTFQTSYTFIEGVRFSDTGYLSPFMVHDEQAIKEGKTETKAVYENPTILVTKKKIAHLNDINPLLETLTKQGKKDLVIFTDDMDSGVASVMVQAHKSKIMNILIIKAPVLWKNYIFEDFAKCVGATIVEDASGINFKNLKMEHLGTCGKIITDKNETVLLGTADISEHLQNLKEEGSNDSLLRLSWLTTKTAILKLGSNSETELSYKMLKMEDAINSCKTALLDGIVEGGGFTLLKVSREMPDTVGGKILTIALQSPMKQIMENAGKTFVPETLLGFNAKTGEWVDMWETNIVDSAKVVKQAVRNAIGIASTVLTTNAVIYTPELSPLEIEMMKLQTKRPF